LLFNSLEFIYFFLPTVLILFYVIGIFHEKASRFFLVLSSLFFYGYWNISYIPIIIGSIAFNYFIANLLQSSKEKIVLIFGISINLLLLGYFKYTDFFIENLNLIFSEEIPLLYITLPLAISFFTFQQISFLVDSYKGEIKETNFLNYSLFVSFFPQLIAGPIVHYKQIMPQLLNKSNHSLNYHNIALGLFLFSIGLFKKVVIADTISINVNNGFDIATELTFIDAWITSLSYTLQLYFDFSGYMDMAMGLAIMFNIRLPINFNSPYKAKNIQDFWRRWHITLSNFLREYIYIPLGGNRKKEFRVWGNILITFLLGGIWHGAGWTFMLWGFLHGFALVVYRIWQKTNIKLNSFFSWFLTFNFINLTWVFFRAENLDDAMKVIKGMFGFSGLVIPGTFSNVSFLSGFKFEYLLFQQDPNYVLTVSILILGFIILFCKNSIHIKDNFTPNFKTLIALGFIFFVSISNMASVNEFLYFNF
jgi:alginate O-acetyltransferase complex protein AlgI